MSSSDNAVTGKVLGGSSELSAATEVSNHSVDVKDPCASDLESNALRQMAYDSHFTEDINMKMRVPEKLIVAQETENSVLFHASSSVFDQSGAYSAATYRMEVPNRIVVTVGEEGVKYGGSHDGQEGLLLEGYHGGQMPEAVALTTPPRKLTLAERDLDALDIPDHRYCCDDDQHQKPDGNSELKTDDSSLSRTESGKAVIAEHVSKPAAFTVNNYKSLLKFAEVGTSGIFGSLRLGTRRLYRQVLQVFDATGNQDQNKADFIVDRKKLKKAQQIGVANSQKSMVLKDRIVPEVQRTDSSEELDDITLLRQQVFKLHRRITTIEKRQAEKSKREMYFYAATIAFWLINGWFFYNRRPY